MKPKLLIPAVLVTVLLVLVPNVHAQNFSWPTTMNFGLPAYSTTIGFSDTAYFDSWTWDTVNAKQIDFSNIQMGTGTSLTDLAVATQNANVTFTSIMQNSKTTLLLDVIKDTVSLTNITGFPNQPGAVTINGAVRAVGDEWSWEPTLKLLTLSLPNSAVPLINPAVVTLDWSGSSGGGGGIGTGGGGGGGVGSNIQNAWTPPPLNFAGTPITLPSTVNGQPYGLVLLLGAVGLALYVGFGREGKSSFGHGKRKKQKWKHEKVWT